MAGQSPAGRFFSRDWLDTLRTRLMIDTFFFTFFYLTFFFFFQPGLARLAISFKGVGGINIKVSRLGLQQSTCSQKWEPRIMRAQGKQKPIVWQGTRRSF